MALHRRRSLGADDRNRATRLGALRLLDRTELIESGIESLAGTRHDAATLIGVLHHLPDAATRIGLLGEITKRLEPDAPLILDGDYRTFDSEPLLRATGASKAPQPTRPRPSSPTLLRAWCRPHPRQRCSGC